MASTLFWHENSGANYEYFAQKNAPFPPSGKGPPNWGFRGASSISTDLIDFRRYFDALVMERLLSADSLEQLFGPHLTLRSNIGVGYGWFTSSTKRGTTEVWSRGGESFGHNSAIRWFPDENVAILIMTRNGSYGDDKDGPNKIVSRELLDLIFDSW